MENPKTMLYKSGLRVGLAREFFAILPCIALIDQIIFSNGMSSKLQNQLRNVVERLLGPKKDRTDGRPSLNSATGKYTGGAYFERYPEVSPVEEGVRAYTLGPTHQRIPNITAPAASAKSGRVLDEHMEIHRDAVNVSHP